MKRLQKRPAETLVLAHRAVIMRAEVTGLEARIAYLPQKMHAVLNPHTPGHREQRRIIGVQKRAGHDQTRARVYPPVIAIEEFYDVFHPLVRHYPADEQEVHLPVTQLPQEGFVLLA